MKFRFLVFAIILTSGSLRAQQIDFWQWNSIALDKKISDKFSIGIDEEIRFYHNASQLNLTYTNLGVSYRPLKFIKIAFLYRFIQKRQDDKSYSLRHRLLFDVSLRHKMKWLTLAYRARIQSQMRDINSSENGKIPESYLRNKFDVKFNISKKFTPFLAAEFRYQFGNARMIEGNYSFNRGRYYVGTDYEFSKKFSVGLYYMIQWEYNIIYPERDYVLGTSFSFSL